jgi:tetratricopeptide (TPR) repeat protein
MATTKRISRKELKQPDEFVSFWATAFEFARIHQREMFIGASVVVVLFLLVWAGTAYSKKKETTASGLLAQAQSLLQPSPAAKAAMAAAEEPPVDAASRERALEILEEVVEDYRRTKACRVGRILLGQLYFENGDYDKAIVTYEGFLESRDRKPELTAMAWEGLAYSHEAKGEFAKALASYERMGESALTNVQGWAYMGVARCSEKLGKPEKALEAYRSLLADHPQHPRAAEARASIARISQSLDGAASPEPAPDTVPASVEE